MSASSGEKDPFIAQLGKIYAGYTGGFAVFVVLLAILEQMGVPDRIIGYLFVFLTIGVYAYIGIISRTAVVAEYYVAGRRVPALYNGMATGSDWMSAASLHRHGGRRSTRSAMAGSPSSWAGPAATCWWPSCSRPTCASSASTRCRTSSARATAATSRARSA